MLEPLRCLEVVWGNGERMMTGEAGEYGTLEEQWDLKLAQMIAQGPGQVDYYRLVSAAQGSMGIVTWASIKCEILPQIHKLFFIPAKNLNDLIECAYHLIRIRIGDELMLMNSSQLAAILGENIHRIEALNESLPPWVIIIGVAGREYLPQERVNFQENDLRDIVQQFGLQLASALPGALDSEVLKALLNPSREPYWKTSYQGGCQDILFLTTLNKTADFLKTMYSVAEVSRYPTSKIGVYIQPVHQGAGCHCEFNLPFDAGNLVEKDGVYELYIKASEELLKQGAYYSRPYGIWANMAYARTAQTTIMLKKVKQIFDPNNILNPGKLCFNT